MNLIKALGIAVGVVIVQLLLLPLFAAPASNIEPRDLPVVVAGPDTATTQFTAQLQAARPGAFAITKVADAAAADAAIKDRSAYGGFIIDQQGPSLHIASAASPAVAALLTQAATQLGQGRPVPVVDLAPLSTDDPRGGGFAAGFFPLVITAMLGAVALFFGVTRVGARIAGVLLLCVLAGIAGAGVLQTWLGVVGGDFWPVAGAIALFVLAVSASILGLASLLGQAGIGVGAILILLIGNALAGAGAAPELLPQPWGDVGQWLPAGAGATLLRATAWFGGAGGEMARWALAAWAAAGLLLTWLGSLRGPRDLTPREAARKLGSAQANA